MERNQQLMGQIENASGQISNQQRDLMASEQILHQYSRNIQKKMQVVATRDRMLQLSQERNVYKKKVIYILFSVIIALLVALISAYTIFGKKMAKQ